MKRIEIIIFKGKTTHDNKIVRGSGCVQKNNNKTYIFGQDANGIYHEVEVVTETIQISRIWKYIK
ncbi:MAG: hypothetical protein SO083_07430 [Megamonas funiformis]|jgi:hypothetical protein|uniref:Uncharacterized protein n=1 Tax=Megamonas funiformis TaxID=437897 RepID=A0AAW4U991_9FIRM|nr:hypothetical protein [Megamonas funiformis]MBS7213220.1 hypothetical protein [Megamonas funiformis]MCB6828816.1 hypothetical protein [Megamonas funiformis]MDY3874983.1 hypothetical protein [Megamonas funiformis]DAU21742.1 MAG TPA: hypothetical protein [Caudoviricetes sp.]